MYVIQVGDYETRCEKMAMPPLKGLYAFEAIVRKGSFKAAAEELCLSRSAVSHQIKALEDILEVPLFQRQKPGISMTDAGQTLYESLSDAFAIVRYSVNRMKTMTNDNIVSIAIPPHFALKWLLPKLSLLKKQHSNINLHLCYTVDGRPNADPNVQISINWLSNRKADIATMRLIDGTLYPACNPEYLEGKHPVKKPEDLLKHTLLHNRQDIYWREWFSKVGLGEVDLNRNEVFDDSNVMYQAAIDGQGIALICPDLVPQEMQARKFVRLFDTGLDSYAYYATVAPAYKDLTKVIRVVNWLRDQSEVD